MQHFLKKYALVLSLLLVLSACSEISTPGEALVVQTASLEPAFNGEEYNATIFSSGGLRPHVCELKGTLPTGVRLDSCSLRGIPTEEGTFSFSIVVSDARLSKVFRDYSLNVQPPPPARVILDVPNTQVSGEFVLPISLEKAKGLLGMRMQLRWQTEIFDFVALRQRRNDIILLQEKQEDGLRVDIASIDGGLQGDMLLFELVLQAKKSDYIQLELATEFATPEAGHDYRTEQAGRAPESLSNSNTTDNTGAVGSER